MTDALFIDTNTKRQPNMIDRITNDIPTAAVAVGAVTSPAWVIALENFNVILALILSILGIILTFVKIIKVWNKDPNPSAHEIAEEIMKEEERVQQDKKGRKNE